MAAAADRHWTDIALEPQRSRLDPLNRQVVLDKVVVGERCLIGPCAVHLAYSN